MHRNETLLFNTAAHLVSACMANVFVAKNGNLKTPCLSTGARPGVVREWVKARTQATEALITRAEVETADEIFLTSSWLGIMPAASIESRTLAARTMSAQLMKEYRDEIGQ